MVIRDDEASPERAAKAYQVMNELMPRFTDIVRTSAGDQGLRVVIRNGWPAPCTDGATVVLPTEAAFADVDPRNPCTCDDNAEACLYHITVGYLLHEAAHISEGSTVRPDHEFMGEVDDSFARLFESGIFPEAFVTEFQSEHDRALQWVADLSHPAADSFPDSALEVAARFNRQAPLLANAFEDARINKAVGEKRSALPQQMERIFQELVIRSVGGGGIANAPLSSQTGAAIEVYLEHGKDLRGVIKSETVTSCLTDPVIRNLLDRFELRSVVDPVVAACVVTEYAREKYGLFDDKASAGHNERKASAPLKSGKDSTEDGSLKQNQRLRERDETEDAARDLRNRTKRNAEATESGRVEYHKQHHEPQTHEDVGDPVMQEVMDAMNEARSGEVSDDLEEVMQTPGGSGVVGLESGSGTYVPVILRPNFSIRNDQGQSGGPIKILDGWKYPSGGTWPAVRRQGVEVTVQQAVMESQRELAEALGMNRRSASTPNLVRGRLHGSKLARVPTGNRRAFRRIDKPRKRSYAVLIGVDQSGSTNGSTNEYLVTLAYAQATLLARLGIPFAVLGHTGEDYPQPSTRTWDSYWESDEVYEATASRVGTRRPHLATLQLAKNFAEPWDGVAQTAVAALHASHQNLDGITLRTYINMLLTQRATDRILLYYTDGRMPAEDRRTQRQILIEECRRAKAMARLPDRRLHLIGVGVDSDSPTKYGLDTILLSEDDGPKGINKVVDGLAQRIAQTLSG